MFKFFGGKTICKEMEKKLGHQSPDSAMWPKICGYLVRGSEPRDAKAKGMLRGYLELREHLGPRANFRNGAELSHESLAEPIAAFFRRQPGRDAGDQRQTWAAFCLAADYILARAHEADFVEGKSRAAQRRAVADLHQEISDRFIEPLNASGAARTAQTPAKEPLRAEAALASEALAA